MNTPKEMYKFHTVASLDCVFLNVSRMEFSLVFFLGFVFISGVHALPTLNFSLFQCVKSSHAKESR